MSSLVWASGVIHMDVIYLDVVSVNSFHCVAGVRAGPPGGGGDRREAQLLQGLLPPGAAEKKTTLSKAIKVRQERGTRKVLYVGLYLLWSFFLAAWRYLFLAFWLSGGLVIFISGCLALSKAYPGCENLMVAGMDISASEVVLLSWSGTQSQNPSVRSDMKQNG